jgi:chorismate-pyruvate lyase
MSQESDGLREVLTKMGIQFERHLILKKSQKPYVKAESFAE